MIFFPLTMLAYKLPLLYAKALHLQGIFFFPLDLNAKNVLLYSYISFPLAVVCIYCTLLFEIVAAF